MKIFRAALAASLALAALQTPAFAQKKNLVKAAEKAVTDAAAQAPRNASVRLKASEVAAIQRAARSASRGLDRVFAGAMKSKNAQTAQLADMASFQLYNEDAGVIAHINRLWSDMVIALHTAYFGPSPHNYVASSTLREKILADESKLNASLKMWANMRKSLLQTAAPQSFPLLKTPGAATRFFFDDVPLDPIEQNLADLLSGKQDAVSVITCGQPDMELLYRMVLAFAHGKSAFPMRTDAVYRFLALNEYSQEELPLLKRDLNSLESELLLNWGWSRKDIRAVITEYQSKNWAQAYEGDPVPLLQVQHELLTTWRNYWKQSGERDLSATARAVSDLRTE